MKDTAAVCINDMGNAAFADGNRPAEVARILREVADKIDAGRTDGVVIDINGNTVGRWHMDEEDEAHTHTDECSIDGDGDDHGSRICGYPE